MNAIHRLWRGDVPLDQVFWNWAALGGIAVNASTSVLFFVLLMWGWTITAFIVGYALTVPYNILVTVGVWRAADRYRGDRQWAVLARIVTVAAMALLTVT